MESREEILRKIQQQLAVECGFELNEDSLLADFGITSLHLITMVLALQQQYGLEVDDLVEHGMPTTVGDLVALVERGATDGSADNTRKT